MTSKLHKKGYRSNNNIYFNCHYHVVWSPKYRQPVLVHGIDASLKKIIREVCEEHLAIVEALEVMPDHVHLLVNIDPQFGICQLIKLVKGRSSFLLRNEYPFLKEQLPSLWTNTYFVSTVGKNTLEVVMNYIEKQRERESWR